MDIQEYKFELQDIFNTTLTVVQEAITSLPPTKAFPYVKLLWDRVIPSLQSVEVKDTRPPVTVIFNAVSQTIKQDTSLLPLNDRGILKIK